MTKDYASGSDKRCPTAEQFREIFAIFVTSDSRCPTGRVTFPENMRKETGTIIHSPSDLIRYLASPFAARLFAAQFVEKRRFFQKERNVLDVLHSIWVGMI